MTLFYNACMQPSPYTEWITELVRRYPDPPRPVTLIDVIRVESRDPYFGWHAVGIIGLLVAAIAVWNAVAGAGPYLSVTAVLLAAFWGLGLFNSIRQERHVARTYVRGIVEIQQVEFREHAPTYRSPTPGPGFPYCVLYWRVILPTRTFDEGPIILARGDRIWDWVIQPGARIEALINPVELGVFHCLWPLPQPAPKVQP
jgi:hypothetical protein